MLLPELRLARYRFTLTCTTRLEWGSLPGSTLRGAFGAVFRRLICVTQQPVCEGCLLRHQCAYGYLFETAPPPQSIRLRNQEQIPRPFVFEPPEPPRSAYEANETFHFHLVLVGRALDYLPYFVYVFQQLSTQGLGRGYRQDQGRYHLTGVSMSQPDDLWQSIFDGQVIHMVFPDTLSTTTLAQQVAHLSSSRITIHFHTATRIQQESKYLHRFEFHHFIRTLLRRISTMLYFHCNHTLDMDFVGLIRQAEQVRIVQDGRRWQAQHRFSSRQQAEVRMDGVVGPVTFEGNLAPFLPLLVLGQWLHVGKGCVMGLGRYELASDNNQP
jgi:hypothetical protein